MTTDTQFMEKALQEARKAYDEGEVPIGAIIAHGEKVISRAHNLTERLRDVTAHAEMQAITMAEAAIGGKYLQECTLYVTVEPCVMCAGALAWAQIKRVVYGATDLKRGFTTFSPHALHPKTEVLGGVLEEECSTLMKQFFSSKR